MRTLYPFSILLKAFAVYQRRNEAKNAMEKWFDARVFANVRGCGRCLCLCVCV